MRTPASITAFIDRHRRQLGPARTLRIATACGRLFHEASVELSDGTVFVATGDIPAMWLRDSTWQVRPLLDMDPDSEVLHYLGAVSRRQARYVLTDPYANAFNPAPDGSCWHRDFDDQSAWVFERKFEIDSLAAFLDLALRTFRETGFREHLDSAFWRAARLTVDVCFQEIHHDQSTYRFQRPGAPSHDTLSNEGQGAPFAPNGMVWSGFRPSDDRCELPYLIPANAHLATMLEWLTQVPGCPGDLVTDASTLASSIADATRTTRDDHGVMPYEVDGLGGRVLMDEPNFPNLLSLPYLGWCDPEDPTYLRTRDWVWSDSNPYFVSSHGYEGFWSEHTPPGWIWPLSIAMRGLTSTDDRERGFCLESLERCSDGPIHESFDPGDPSRFTRPWFSWADMTFVQLALSLGTNHRTRSRVEEGE